MRTIQSVSTAARFELGTFGAWLLAEPDVSGSPGEQNGRTFGIAAVLALQAMFIYAPFMHAIFASGPLTIDDVVTSIVVGAIILPGISLEKMWHARVARASGTRISGLLKSVVHDGQFLSAWFRSALRTAR